MERGTNTANQAVGGLAECSTPRPRDDVGTIAPGPVLVAVDMTWESRAALLWACRHAPNPDAPLIALHVVHDPPEAPGKYSLASSDPLTPMADAAEKMLSEFIDEVRDNHPELTRLATARTTMVNGLPAQTIVDQAARLSASLIVVGCRGQNNLRSLMYGSTAKKVVQLSQIPVTVVKDPI